MKVAQIIYGVAGGGAPNVALTAEMLKSDSITVHVIRINIPYNNKKETNALKNSLEIKNFISKTKKNRI